MYPFYFYFFISLLITYMNNQQYYQQQLPPPSVPSLQPLPYPSLQQNQQGYQNNNYNENQNLYNHSSYSINNNHNSYNNVYSFNKNNTENTQYTNQSSVECQSSTTPIMSVSPMEPLNPHLDKKFIEIIVRQSNNNKIQQQQQKQQPLIEEDSTFDDIENFDNFDIEPPIEEFPFNCCICTKPSKNPLSVICSLSQLKELTIEVNVTFWYYDFLTSFDEVDVNDICMFHICFNCSKLFEKQVIQSNNGIYKYILVSSKITL